MSFKSIVGCIFSAILCVIPGAWADQEVNVNINPQELWAEAPPNAGATLTVSCTDGVFSRQIFSPGETPYFSLDEHGLQTSGSCKYELRLITAEAQGDNRGVALDSQGQTQIQTGEVEIVNGQLTTPAPEAAEEIAQTHNHSH